MQTLHERLQNATIGLAAVIFALTLSYIATLFLKKQMGQEWKEFLKTNYVFMFGIPLAVTAAFGLVVFFGVTSPDPIELNIWGLVLKGPAGPLLMWVVVFLSLVLAIKVLWPR